MIYYRINKQQLLRESDENKWIILFQIMFFFLLKGCQNQTHIWCDYIPTCGLQLLLWARYCIETEWKSHRWTTVPSSRQWWLWFCKMVQDGKAQLVIFISLRRIAVQCIYCRAVWRISGSRVPDKPLGYPNRNLSRVPVILHCGKKKEIWLGSEKVLF